MANHHPPFDPQSAASVIDSGDLRPGGRNRRRGKLELSRLGCRAADAVVGFDVERRPAVSPRRAASHDLSGLGADVYGFGVEYRRRHAAGTITNAQPLNPFNSSSRSKRSGPFKKKGRAWTRSLCSSDDLNHLNDLNDLNPVDIDHYRRVRHETLFQSHLTLRPQDKDCPGGEENSL